MLKTIKWLLKNMLLGLVILYVINILGVYINLNIPINIITIFIVGALRIPGVIMLIILMNL